MVLEKGILYWILYMGQIWSYRQLRELFWVVAREQCDNKGRVRNMQWCCPSYYNKWARSKGMPAPAYAGLSHWEQYSNLMHTPLIHYLNRESIVVFDVFPITLLSNISRWPRWEVGHLIYLILCNFSALVPPFFIFVFHWLCCGENYQWNCVRRRDFLSCDYVIRTDPRIGTPYKMPQKASLFLLLRGNRAG